MAGEDGPRRHAAKLGRLSSSLVVFGGALMIWSAWLPWIGIGESLGEGERAGRDLVTGRVVLALGVFTAVSALLPRGWKATALVSTALSVPWLTGTFLFQLLPVPIGVITGYWMAWTGVILGFIGGLAAGKAIELRTRYPRLFKRQRGVRG